MNPVISAWSAVSAFGVGRDQFAAAVRSGPAADTASPESDWAGPGLPPRLVPVEGPKELLGRKGTRSMDRATALAVTAVGRLLGSDGPADNGTASSAPGPGDQDAGPGGGRDEEALVLGTSTGSARSIMSFTRDALTEDRPYHVNPAHFPNTVMNCAAGQTAIWHQLHGPNVTLAGGRMSALLALNHARRLQDSGRARGVIFGAVEEFSIERAWLEWHSRDADQAPAQLGEGCAVLLLQPGDQAGPEGPAEVLAVRTRLCSGPDAVADALNRCIRGAFDAAAADPQDVWIVAPSQAPGPWGEAEAVTLEGLFPASSVRRAFATALVGDTGAASAAFGLIAVLAAAQGEPEAGGRLALVTSTEREGRVGCALLRLIDAPATKQTAA
jgi:3-oxoacyl-[acyl-carrier-protein] synthase II